MKTDNKSAAIADNQVHAKDTGSYMVQIAIFTARIAHLTNHLKANPKDKHSRRGLLGMVAKRRKLLKNLKEKNYKAYEELIVKLGIRK